MLRRISLQIQSNSHFLQFDNYYLTYFINDIFNTIFPLQTKSPNSFNTKVEKRQSPAKIAVSPALVSNDAKQVAINKFKEQYLSKKSPILSKKQTLQQLHQQQQQKVEEVKKSAKENMQSSTSKPGTPRPEKSATRLQLLAKLAARNSPRPSEQKNEPPKPAETDDLMIPARPSSADHIDDSSASDLPVLRPISQQMSIVLLRSSCSKLAMTSPRFPNIDMGIIKTTTADGAFDSFGAKSELVRNQMTASLLRTIKLKPEDQNDFDSDVTKLAKKFVYVIGSCREELLQLADDSKLRAMYSVIKQFKPQYLELQKAVDSLSGKMTIQRRVQVKIIVERERNRIQATLQRKVARYTSNRSFSASSRPRSDKFDEFALSRLKDSEFIDTVADSK